MRDALFAMIAMAPVILGPMVFEGSPKTVHPSPTDSCQTPDGAVIGVADVDDPNSEIAGTDAQMSVGCPTK